MKRHLLTAVVLLVVPLGCGEDSSLPAPEGACPAGNMVGDVCAGVPSAPLCTSGACTVGSCNETFAVNDAVSLDDAIAKAQAGDCIALEPGSYAAVTLPDGVSLFGRSAEETKVASVSTSGSEVRVRGITIDTGSVTVTSGLTRLDAVRVVDSASDAVDVAPGASVTIERSEIKRAARYGVSAFDAGSVSVTASIIADNGGPGMWLQASAGCLATTPVVGTVTNSAIRANRIVGVSIVAGQVAFDNVDVRETSTGSGFDYGGGVAISQCSQIKANLLRVSDNVDFGMLIDDSTVRLTEATVHDNLRGIAIQNIGASDAAAVVQIEDSIVSANRGVGIGIDGGSLGVTVRNSSVIDTAIVALPVKIGSVSAGVEQVGDGLAWLGLSQVKLESVTISNSARASLLIDGSVESGSSIADLLLSGGDEQKGIVQQNLEASGTQPTTSGSTPTVSTSESEQFAIPLDLAIPPGI